METRKGINVTGSGLRRFWGAAAAMALAGVLLIAPASASAASAGLKPSEAPLVAVGQHYFGNTQHEWNAGCCTTTVDLWHLPPLLTADVLTVAWHAGQNEEGVRLCLAQDVDDYDWAENYPNGSWHVCNGSQQYTVSGSGSARTTLQVRSSTANGYLEVLGSGPQWPGPYDFTIESIQHAIGVGLSPVTRIKPTSILTGSANLSDGSPVPDGLAFTLSASWVTPVNKASHSRSYTVTSSGGALTFPLNLPSSAQGKHVSLTVARPADPQYLAASSPAIEATVARLTPRHHHRRRHHHQHQHRHRRHLA
jgi:hypothetical protein